MSWRLLTRPSWPAIGMWFTPSGEPGSQFTGHPVTGGLSRLMSHPVDDSVNRCRTNRLSEAGVTGSLPRSGCGGKIQQVVSIWWARPGGQQDCGPTAAGVGKTRVAAVNWGPNRVPQRLGDHAKGADLDRVITTPG